MQQSCSSRTNAATSPGNKYAFVHMAKIRRDARKRASLKFEV
jgi:hypothetical protein